MTSEKLTPPLEQGWVYTAPTPPQTAWPGPAKWDAYATLKGLRSMRDFDPVFYVTVMGNSVTFGSSVDDAVHCFDAATGREKWTYCTDGPVRLPPAWNEGKVYFGSDDGYAYCVDAEKGSLIWKYKPASDGRVIPSNGKLLSLWPCRTGALVQGGKVYFAASLLPWDVSYLCALDSGTGSDSGPGLYKAARKGLAMQGAVLASATRLYFSQGRSSPLVCDRATGKLLGTFGKGGDGGVYALLTEDDTFIHGRGQNHRTRGELRGFNAETRDYLATFPHGTCMIATEKMAYLHSLTELGAFDRIRYLDLQKEKNKLIGRRDQMKKQLKELVKKPNAEKAKKLSAGLKEVGAALAKINKALPTCYLWKKPSKYPHALILAGDVLFAGGTDEVAAFGIRDGRQLWTAPVTGKAHGLAIANGRLFVSTDRGKIYCFVKG